MSMFTGYLQLGGVEIANSDRVHGYVHTADCITPSFEQEPCGTLQAALRDEPYDAAQIFSAPWYDPNSHDLSSRFYGVSAFDISGVHDSTRSMSVTQAIREGGIIGNVRHGTKSVRVKALLHADGEDALDYGLNWLTAVLEPGSCGQHGDSCGLTDLTFLTTCPPEMPTVPDPDDPDILIPDLDEMDRLMRPIERYMHDVAVTSGPVVREYLGSRQNPRGMKAAEVEFTVTSERGYIYSRAVDVPLLATPDATETVQRNLFTNPTADMTGPIMVGWRRNLIVNSSLETNLTGWSASGVTSPGGTAVTVPLTRATGELRAVGDASAKGAVPAAASGQKNHGTITQESTVSASGARVIIGIWGAVTDPSNTVTRLWAEYRLGTGAWLPLDEAIDVAAAKGGKTYRSADHITLPVGATASVGVRFRAEGTAAFTMYADAAMLIEG